MCQSHPLRDLAGSLIIQQGHIHPVRHPIKQAGLDPGALPGDPPGDQRLKHRGMGRHAAGDVAHRNPHTARPRGMPGDGRQPAFRLNQQIIGLHVRGAMPGAIAGYVHGNQPGIALPQLRRPKPRTGRGPGRQVLDEHVGTSQNTVQQRRIVRRLDIGRQTFLAAIQPNKVAGQPGNRPVIASGEIPFRPFDLDDPRPGVSQTGTAIRRRDRLLQRKHEQPIQRASRHTLLPRTHRASLPSSRTSPVCFAIQSASQHFKRITASTENNKFR